MSSTNGNSWDFSRLAGGDLRPQWEFHAVLKGQCAPILEGNRSSGELKEKTLWVFAPECSYRWAAARNQASQRVVLHFASVPFPLDKIVREKGYLTKTLNPDEARQVEAIVAELGGHFQTSHPNSASAGAHRLMDLAAIALARNDTRVSSALHDVARLKVNHALAWYARRLKERPSISEVAKAVSLSSRLLRCLFRQVHHANPKVVLQNLRLRKACQLFRHPDLTIEQIARRCGYSDACHLRREHQNLRQQSLRSVKRGRQSKAKAHVIATPQNEVALRLWAGVARRSLPASP